MIGGEPYDIKNYENGIIKINNTYIYVKNNKQVSNKDLKRIKKLKIPPSWTDIWISINPQSDIQALGTDLSGRKQYKYNEKYVKQSEKKKFIRLYKFVKKLPKLISTLKRHSHLNPYNKNSVISTMLQIVKELYIRVGKEKYAKENKSYGISSLKKQHIKLNGNTLILRFKGKSHQQLYYTLDNKNISNHIQQLLKLKGDKIFQYLDEFGNIHKITDTDLNQYIQHYMGSEFTVKDFRTYGANFYFIKFIINETKKRSPSNSKIIKKNIVNAIKLTAHSLRHTKNISKKSYIMTFCIDYYIHNPYFFVARKFDDPNDVLTELLKMYIKKIKKN